MFSILLCVLIAVSLIGCGDDDDSNSIDDIDAALDGSTLYAENCAVCHGASAEGDLGPNIRGKTSDEIQNALATVPEMTNVDVTDDEVTEIAAYLATLD